MKNNKRKQKIFVTADLHFNHNNMIRFSPNTRGHFIDVDEMNKTIIENWNQVVEENDLVYLLGDLAFCSVNKTKYFLEQLNGKIILIKGNHDNYKDIKKYQHLYI